MYGNKLYSISHRKYWIMLCEELGITTIKDESDACHFGNTFQKFRVDKESFDRERNDHYLGLEQYNIFTDGSKMDDRVGTAYQIWNGDQPQRSWRARLADNATVFQAEIAAIAEAAAFVGTYQDKPTCKFFVDS